ncbi:MAG: hypothetical protein IPI32_08470 [Austwickia sp.]|nr:hypothetical protein [Austwickia sp.]MBK9102162.1 hypothetical protein [Austwickia sp.]
MRNSVVAAAALSVLPIAGFAAQSANATAMTPKTPTPSPLAAVTHMLECGSDDSVQAPAVFTLDCSASTTKTYLEGMKWSGWGHDSANATGYLVKERPSTTGRANITRYPVAVTATKLAKREATQVYTKLAVRFTHAVPTGMDRVLCFYLAKEGRTQAPTPARTATRYMIECVDGNFVKKPTRFTLACGDDLEYLEKLRWKMWGPTSAKASGLLTVEPTYAEPGPTLRYPVTVVADRVQAGQGKQLFTRLKITFTGKKAPFEPRVMTVDLPR